MQDLSEDPRGSDADGNDGAADVPDPSTFQSFGRRATLTAALAGNTFKKVKMFKLSLKKYFKYRFSRPILTISTDMTEITTLLHIET